MELQIINEQEVLGKHFTVYGTADEPLFLANGFGYRCSVSPSAITQLFKDGKGSDDLKLRIKKKLRIRESWERFEE